MSSISQQDKSQFYQKAFLAGLISFVGRRREDSNDGAAAPLLRLHECLATVSVAQVKKEVIACHIAPGNGSSTLHMSRNDVWTNVQKEHVQKVRNLLAQMGQQPDRISALKTQLQDLIFKYCQAKVQSRIGKFLRTVDYVLEEDLSKNIKELFPHDADDATKLKELEAIVSVIKHDLRELEKYLRQSAAASSLAGNSQRCRECAQHWASNTGKYKGVLEIVREKFPYVEKRMLKVASYSKSVDVLSDWATGTGDYGQYRQSYPVPNSTISYSTPDTQPTSKLMEVKSWDAIAKEYYRNDATDTRIDLFKQFNPSLANDPKPPTSLYLHAEMHIVRDLLAQASSTQQNVYIGISKLCCYLCYHCIRTINNARARHLHVFVKGTHNKFYSTWLIPSTFDTRSELLTLQQNVDALNSQALQAPKKVEGGTDESAPVTLSTLAHA